MVISNDLKRIYASAPTDVKYIETLQLTHPAFAVPHFVTNDELEWDFILEDGSAQHFVRAPFQLQLPVHDDQGRQDLQIAMGNIGREMMSEVEAAITQPRSPINCIYRVFLNTPGSTPQTNPPINLNIMTMDVTTSTISAVASRADVLNKRFPADVYRLSEFPGLDR